MKPRISIADHGNLTIGPSVDCLVTFTLPAPTLTVLVLSRLDERYFRDISARSYWNLNFVLVKEGEKEPIAESVHALFWARSVNLDIELEAGKYFVYVSSHLDFHNEQGSSKHCFLQVRIDRELDYWSAYAPTIDDWQLRKLSYIMAARAKSRSIASSKISRTIDALVIYGSLICYRFQSKVS